MTRRGGRNSGGGCLWVSVGLACALAACALAACDAPSVDPDAGSDAGPTPIPTLDHCTFQEVPPTGGAGGTVTPGPLRAGVAEAFLDVPLGASLAAYTDRAEGFGGTGFVPDSRDRRHTYLAGSFSPSVGIETIPRIRALALSAGGETVVILKVDLGFSYQGFVHDVEAALGPEFSGKIVVATSHTHSSFGNFTGHSLLHGGAGRFRSSVYRPIIEQLTAAARAAIDDLRPARIGFAYDGEFDSENRVNRDRRSENDDLVGGPEDDHHLYVIRVDAEDGTPMALVPVFGMHGTIHGGQNAIVTTESLGGVERVLEEAFDTGVLVMHLQGAGGDVSPAGHGAIDCEGAPVCTDFARAETIGWFARDAILAAWTSAGEDMRSELEIEMLTRTVPLGPDYRNFTIRGGALEYAPWNLAREADGIVLDDEGRLVSPIDEFNAPFGVGLCDAYRVALMPRAQMPGTRNLVGFTYRGCNRIEQIDEAMESLLDLEFEEPPICQTTQTTVSALRIGDHMVATLPGEPTTQLADHLRSLSPAGTDRTIVVGYAQDHVGYLLRPEDWIRGGYEPSITWWGPLEAERIVEHVAALFPLATSPEREDGNAEGIARVATPMVEDDFPRDELATAPGTVPETLPEYIFTRMLREVPSAQPAPTVPRLGTVFFTWAGEDPMDGTPRVFLEREVETEPGTFEWQTVVRRSGRPVQDGDLVLTWTPDPIEPQPGTPRTHYYTVEFQAVTPLGMPGLESLADRAGLPLGRYRFRIEGTGYELASDPFTVEPATLMETHEVSGSALNVTLRYPVARDGFRLMALTGRSNAPVPVRNETVTVVQHTGSGDVSSELTTDGDGALTVPLEAGATSIDITDRFGNAVTITL